MMLVDANAVVGLLVESRGRQHREAVAFATERGPLSVGESVLVETCWVLERSYGMSRSTVAALLRAALATEELVSWDPDVSERALHIMERLPSLSIVDSLLLARAADGNAVFTFDRRLLRAVERL